jgi:hypothetical protein
MATAAASGAIALAPGARAAALMSIIGSGHS